MSSEQTATVVVAAVIVQNGKVLLSQKKKSHNPENVGKWEFPGGKVRYGEHFEDALRREVKEELNLDTKVDRLLHSQINAYSEGVDYLVLYYACTLFGIVEYLPGIGIMFVEPSKVLDSATIFGVLPGTLEALGHLGEVTSTEEVFSFVQNDAVNQTVDETLHVMTYNLGKVIEYHHKAKRYGPTAYYSDSNQQKEMSDLLSMCRMYCEQKGWSLDELLTLGEVAYVEKMEDLRKHGLTGQVQE